MVKKCTPCIQRANQDSPFAYDVPIRIVPLHSPCQSGKSLCIVRAKYAQIRSCSCPLQYPPGSHCLFFWTPTRVSVRCPIGHTGARMCACGKVRPPTHSAARTPSQAPLGWGRVPPCTGPRRAGLPKSSFPLSRSIQYISPQLARATMQASRTASF